MTLQLTLTHLLTLALFFIGTLFGLVKYIAYQQEKRENERFAVLGTQLTKLGDDLKLEASATLQLERKFMQYQADLPREYVRRDDFLRSIGTIEVRVDNMALRMERALASRTTGGAQ